jgi:uncharacterized protein involved in outer membrane biogenesis
MVGRVAKAVRRALLVGTIALLLLAAGGLWLARSEWGQRWAAARVSTALGPSVRFAEARFTPWPPPLAVELDGVEMLGAGDVPVARARRLRGRVRLRALLGRPPLLASVAVDDFEAEITRSADGTINVGTRALGGTGGGAAPSALDAECPVVDLTDARITLRDASDAVAPVVEIEDISAHLVPSRPGARLTLNGRSAQIGTLRAVLHLDSLGELASAPFSAELEAREADAATVAAWLPRGGGALTMSGRGRMTATLRGRPTAGQVEAAIHLREGRIAWHDLAQASTPLVLTLRGDWGADALTTASGQIEIADARAAGLVATAVRAAFIADREGVTLRDARWRALGGTWQQSGTLRLAEGVTVDGAVDAASVDGAALAGALRPLLGATADPLRLDGDVRLHVGASGTVGGPISGQVAVSMASGTVGWATASAAAPLALSADATLEGGAVTLRNGRAQAAAVGDGDLRATSLDARFGFADRALRIDALSAQAFDGTWTVSGTIPLDGPPVVSLSAVGINAAHLARAVLTGRPDETGTAGDVDATATVSGSSGTLALRLASPTLTVGPVVIAQPATASGTLTWRDGAMQVGDGRAQLDRARVGATEVGNVRAAFASAGPGRLRLAPLSARAFGGLWTADVTLGRDAIDGTIRASGISLDPLLAALDADPRSQGASASFTATLHRPRQGTTTAEVAVQLARGRLLFNDLTVVAPARGAATVRVDGARWSVENGTASAAAASYAMLRGIHPSARLGFDPDQIRFADLRVTTAGAPWQGSGRIALSAPPQIDGEIAVQRADPDALLRMLGINAPALDPDGLDLALRTRGPLGAAWQQSLRGNGTLTLRGGTLNSTDLLRAVVAAVVPSRWLREGGPPNRLNSLRMTFTLSDGSAHTDDLTTRSDDYDLTANGTIGLDGRLDLDSRVTLTPNGIKKIFALSAIPLPGSSLLSLPTIPTRIDGNLDDPQVHPEAAALAGTTARWFGAALIGAPVRMGEAVGRPLEQAYDGIRNLLAPRTPTPPAAP